MQQVGGLGVAARSAHRHFRGSGGMLPAGEGLREGEGLQLPEFDGRPFRCRRPVQHLPVGVDAGDQQLLPGEQPFGDAVGGGAVLEHAPVLRGQ